MSVLIDYVAMLRVAWQKRRLSLARSTDDEHLRFCYEVLQDVSRSFAMVIAQLNDELRAAVCVYYLVLRALDTIEDDMSLSVPFKLEELPQFHTHLDNLEWCMSGVGEGRERELLEKYPHVSHAYAALKKPYRAAIRENCKKMADGMCDFLQRPVVTKADYDLYCHYVAGIVGYGLTQIFVECSTEDPSLADDLTNANHMGLFLQKTNIIRDYYADFCENPPRRFWPREIWSPHAADLSDFKDPANRPNAVRCLDEMVADALTHAPFVFDYLAALQEDSIFKFSAIPQTMAIATLAEVYHNPDVFTRTVKIPRKLACRLMTQSTNMRNVLGLFDEHIGVILSKMDGSVPHREAVRELREEVRRRREACSPPQEEVGYVRSLLTRYPALGGQLLYSLVDSITGYFSPNRGGQPEVETA